MERIIVKCSESWLIGVLYTNRMVGIGHIQKYLVVSTALRPNSSIEENAFPSGILAEDTHSQKPGLRLRDKPK